MPRMSQTFDLLIKSPAWDLAWLSVLVAVALIALRGNGSDAEDAGDAD